MLVGYLVVMGKVQLSCGNEMCQLGCVCVLIQIKYRINKIKAVNIFNNILLLSFFKYICLASRMLVSTMQRLMEVF